MVSSFAGTSDIMFRSFSLQCPQVITKDVSMSLQNILAVKSLIEEIKSESNCSGSSQLGIVLDRYRDLYQEFEMRSDSKKERIELEKKISRYTEILLDPALSPTDRAFLEQELIVSQANLISINSKIKRFESMSGREAKAANQLILSVDQFIKTLEQNPVCLEKRGTKVASLLSNVLLTTSLFVNPGTALGLATAGVITESVSQFLKNHKFDKTLNQLNELQLPLALRCYSEVITNQFCGMQDAAVILNQRQNEIDNQTFQTTQSLEILNLLTHNLDGLTKWLDAVRAGSPVSSEGELLTREKPITVLEFLEKVLRYVDTYGVMRIKIFNQISTPRELSAAISQSIDNLVQIMDVPTLEPIFTPGGVFNPVFIRRPKDLMPYELYKPGSFQGVPKCGDSPCQSFQDYVSQEGIFLTKEDWANAVNNSKIFTQETLDQINLDVVKGRSNDLYSTIIQATREVRGETNAINGLFKIHEQGKIVSDRLKKYGCKADPMNCETSRNPYFSQYNNVKITLDLTEQIISLIREGQIPRSIPEAKFPKTCKGQLNEGPNDSIDEYDPESKSFKIVTCITKLLKLDQAGTDYYLNKVRNLVSYDLEARLKNQDLKSSVGNVINATRNDLVSTLINSYKTSDTTLSISDILLGIETAQSHLGKISLEMSQFFKNDLVNAFKNEKLSPTELKDLCFRSVIYFNEKDQDLMETIYKKCSQVSMQTYKQGPKIDFSTFIAKEKSYLGLRQKYKVQQNVTSLWCQQRDFSRKNKIIDEKFFATESASQNTQTPEADTQELLSPKMPKEKENGVEIDQKKNSRPKRERWIIQPQLP